VGLPQILFVLCDLFLLMFLNKGDFVVKEFLFNTLDIKKLYGILRHLMQHKTNFLIKKKEFLFNLMVDKKFLSLYSVIIRLITGKI